MKEEFTCESCFDSNYIKKYIKNNSKTRGKCDFCQQENISIISLKTISEYIKTCLKKKYDFYNHTNIKNNDMELLIKQECECSPQLAKEIIKYLNLQNSYRLKKDNHLKLLGPYADSLNEFSFSKFAFQVKHLHRFFLEKEDIAFLEQLSNLLINNLTSLLPKTILYRARKGEYNKISDLFSPPYPYSKTGNRMTPAGTEKALYLSDTPNTALLEVKGIITTIAKVKIIKSLFVLDLTSLNNIKEISCFDENYDLYSFLKDFVNEISKPISSEAQEYEYVPTQIITEYLKKKLDIQGIIYPSSVSKNGKNYVLFLNENAFVPNEKFPNIGNKYLEFYDLKVISREGGNPEYMSDEQRTINAKAEANHKAQDF